MIKDGKLVSSWDQKPFEGSACATCKHWKPRDEIKSQGECRRYAPRPTGGMEIMIAEALSKTAHLAELEATEYYRAAMWPRTDDYDFCGEYND